MEGCEHAKMHDILSKYKSNGHPCKIKFIFIVVSNIDFRCVFLLISKNLSYTLSQRIQFSS